MARSPLPVLILVLALVAVAGGAAAEEEAPRFRQVDPTLRVDLPTEALALRDDVRLTEGPRLLVDRFPYLAHAPLARSSTLATPLDPSNLPDVLAARPTDGGGSMAVRDAAGALAAARLFVGGPLVRDEDTLAALVAAGRRLAGELDHLRATVREHRPERVVPLATPRRQGAGDGAAQAWDVSFVAFEVDRVLRVVHVTGTVTAGGAVTLERTPIVDGPPTAWQTAHLGEEDPGAQETERAMREEAAYARRVLGAALPLAGVTDDDAWAVVRALGTRDAIADLLGPGEALEHGGAEARTWALADGRRLEAGFDGDRLVAAWSLPLDARPGAAPPPEPRWHRVVRRP